MTNAYRDENGVPTMIAALNTDGITVTRIKINPSTNRLKTSDGTSGTDYGRSVAYRDENSVPVIMGVSSADGITPIEIYADSSGNLLTKST